MRTWKRILVSSVLATSVVAVPIMAHADSGNGQLTCDGGEICLSRDSGSFTWQKHFWWAAEHGGYYWTNVNDGTGGTTVVNSASAVKNRDTGCTVKVINDRGALPDYVQIFAANSNTWFSLVSGVNDANDRHERC